MWWTRDTDFSRRKRSCPQIAQFLTFVCAHWFECLSSVSTFQNRWGRPCLGHRDRSRCSPAWCLYECSSSREAVSSFSRLGRPVYSWLLDWTVFAGIVFGAKISWDPGPKPDIFDSERGQAGRLKDLHLWGTQLSFMSLCRRSVLGILSKQPKT